MKIFKIPILSAIATMAMGALVACSSAEEPAVPVPDAPFGDQETVNVQFTVLVPDQEMRTRASSDTEQTIGDDGLFSFPQDVNVLKFALYKEGKLVDCSKKNIAANEFSVKEDGTFSMSLVLPKDLTAEEVASYQLFLIASDRRNVCMTRTREELSMQYPYWVEAEKHKLHFNYQLIHSQHSSNGGKVWDRPECFTAISSLADLINDDGSTKPIVLHRPYAEVNILTDELNDDPGNYDKVGYTFTDWDNGSGLLVAAEIYKNLPVAWDFITDDLDFSNGPFTMTSNVYGYSHRSQNLQTVTFEGKTMQCLASYQWLLPGRDHPLSIHHRITVGGNFAVKSYEVFVEKLDVMLNQNHKYVIRNKSTDESGNPAGFFTDYKVVDVSHDTEWSNTQTLEH